MTDPQRDAHDDGTPCGCSEAQLERIHEYLDGALTVEDVRAILTARQMSVWYKNFQNDAATHLKVARFRDRFMGHT